MGISRYFGDVLNVPNLFRNGGLDFQDPSAATPPYYLITGALNGSQAGDTDNRWYQVFGEVPTVAGAPTNYLRVVLPQPEFVTLSQDFLNTLGGTLPFTVPVNTSAQMLSAQDSFELVPEGYVSEEANLLYQGDFTISFSLRVIQGSVAVGFSYMNDKGDASTTPVYTELDSAFSKSTWTRFTGSFNSGKTRLGTAGVQVRRRGREQIVEVHVGNIMLASGAYSDLPYTGDPAAMVFPKGAIIMALGMQCPPGFVAIPETDVYPRMTTPGSSGGDVHHEHDIEQEMLPKVGWPRRSLLASGDARDFANVQSDPESKGDAADFHTHTIADDAGTNNTEPNFRGYLFCKRV